MAQFNARQESFLRRRRNIIKAWPYVGGGLLAALALFCVWVYLRSPLLIDPTEIVRRLQGDGLDPATTMTMAGLVPLLFLACIFLLFVLVLFTFARFHVESKYLHLIDQRPD